MNEEEFFDYSEKNSLKFPDSFLWGAATASYQVEGGIENNDWARASKEGRVPICGRACDHYNRYEEDFKIAKSLSHNTHRLSLEWSRIEPTQGVFDEEEISHYKNVLDSLKKNNLEPFVTLWHFTLPVWFVDIGGFENEDAPDLFARYCKFVTEKLGDRVKFWITINEPLVLSSHSYLLGKWPPFKKNIFKYLTVQSSLVKSHIKAYEEMKKIYPHIQVGIAKNNAYFKADWKPWNKIFKIIAVWFRNERFLNRISKYQDFIGLNHYRFIKFGNQNKLPKSDIGWTIFPESIYFCLIELKKYNKPIYVTENGIADRHDKFRGKYIKDSLYYIKKAMDDGAKVYGYMHWSLLDNYEWTYGFEKRFGLVRIDYQTLERIPRSSALVYKRIIENSL